jgi:hypothetical protein
MATNLQGDVCIGQHSVCLLRAAALADDCSPAGGTDSGIVTLGIITLTASAEVEEGRRFRPKNGCGRVSWVHEEADVITGYNLTGELSYHDLEMKYLLFGGTLITGHGTASDYPGKTIGYAVPHYQDAPTNGVYLEVLVRNVSAESGECAAQGDDVPYATGYIFGKAKLTTGDRTFEDAESSVPFTGRATSNPALFNGPWNDWVGDGYIPNSPSVEVQYSRAEYEAIAAVARCGFQTLPAAS